MWYILLCIYNKLNFFLWYGIMNKNVCYTYRNIYIIYNELRFDVFYIKGIFVN